MTDCDRLCRMVAIALTTVAVLPVVAFDWKPKPTAQLKADFVAYAREIGETNLADCVDRSADTAEWMRMAIQRGTELLKASELTGRSTGSSRRSWS